VLQVLKQLRASPEEVLHRTPDCLTGQAVLALTAGKTGDGAAEKQLAHAAECAYCGAMLRAALTLDELPEQPPREIPQKLAMRRRGGLWIGIAAAALFAATPFAYRIARPEPLRLLADAYSEARPFAARFPGAAHAPVSQVRAGAVALDRPRLIRAAAILQARRSDVDYPLWKGSYELLTLNLDPAVESLRYAHQARKDPHAAILLAAALYQRGVGAKRQEDLLEALDLLSPIVRGSHVSAEASFNFALVLEALNMRSEAALAWRQAERSSGAGPWANEARSRFQEIDQALRARSEMSERLSTDPIGALADSTKSPPELLLHAAWTDWYPNLEADREKRTAMGRLAELSIEVHSDPMLVDALSGRYMPDAAAKLAGAIRLNRAGGGDQGAALAGEVAETAGLARWNRAVWLRARAERVYALHLQYRNAECLEEAATLDRQLRSTSYAWLKAQVRLELANCLSFRNDYAGAIEAARQAREIAAAARYEELELRAAGLASGFRNLAGDLSGTLHEDPAALARYWTKPFAPNRAAQFFHNAVRASEALGFPHAALESAKARLDVMEGAGAPAIQARGRSQLALLAIRLGDRDMAGKQLEEAHRDFSRIAPAAAIRTDAEIDLLQARMLMGEQGGSDSALARLEEVMRNPPTADARLRAHELAARIALAHPGRMEQARQYAEEGIRLHQDRIRGLAGWSRYQARSSYQGLYRAKALYELEQRRDTRASLRAWLSSRGTAVDEEAWQDMVRRLGERTLVVFAELGSGVQRFALGREGLSVRKLSTGDLELRKAAEELRRLAANPASAAALVEAGRRGLANDLLEGLDGASGLVIMTDSGLANLPWRLLAERDFEVYRTACCQEASALELASGLVLTPNVREPFASLYPPLPDAQAEASYVSMAGIRARAVRGVEAGRDAVKPEGDLFHFAGHATPGGLVMASPNGFTLFDPVSASKLDWSSCKLVMLSACSTAVGSSRSNLGSQALADGFLAGGARNVVASLWNVDTAATRVLMKVFYAGLRDRLPPAQALSRAVKAVKANPEWRHPYFWAAFQLYR
jgi:hypothetical protein